MKAHDLQHDSLFGLTKPIVDWHPRVIKISNHTGSALINSGAMLSSIPNSYILK